MAAAVNRDADRPWWGIGDVLLSVPFIVVFATVGAVLGIFLGANGDLNAIETSIGFMAIAAVFQQAGQVVWPWLVSRWKGRGMRLDWRWEFKLIDIAIAIGLVILMQLTALVSGDLVSRIVDLQDGSTATNTDILTDSQGSLWMIVVIFAVVIGAPFSEELMFRGLILRAFEKRMGLVMGVVISTILFAVIHVNGQNLFSDGQIVLWAQIFPVGAILGIAAAKCNRLGPPIIAHVLFNLTSTVAVLTGIG